MHVCVYVCVCVCVYMCMHVCMFLTAEDMANDADDKGRQKKGIINVNALHIYNMQCIHM